MTVPTDDPNKHTQWTGHQQNQWMPTRATTDKLNPGIYIMEMSMMGPYLYSHDVSHDRAIVVEESISQHVLTGIKKFVAAKDRYKKFGLLHKRGILLEGPPGTGKTMTAMIVAEGVVEMGGITIIPSPQVLEHLGALARFMDWTREIQPDLFCTFLWEDLHKFADDEDVMDAFLLLLDGYSQIDNVVHIATTNFIQELDGRLRNRPGRFDEVHSIGAPNEKARRSYIQQIIPSDEHNPKTVDALVKCSEGLMLAHLKELVAVTLCQGLPMDDVAKRLKAMNAPEEDNEATDAAMLGTLPAGHVWAAVPVTRKPTTKRRR